MNSPNSRNLLASPQFKTLLNSCIHCGLCLPSCPTYTVFGTEMASPRGRIALMRAASEGRIEFLDTFQEHINLCLVCRACEQACPSGVQYGALMETTRIVLKQERPSGLIERILHWLLLRQMMPHVGRLRFVAWWMRLYQVLGVQRLVRALNFFPKNLKNMEALLPPISVPITGVLRLQPGSAGGK